MTTHIDNDNPHLTTDVANHLLAQLFVVLDLLKLLFQLLLSRLSLTIFYHVGHNIFLLRIELIIAPQRWLGLVTNVTHNNNNVRPHCS